MTCTSKILAAAILALTAGLSGVSAQTTRPARGAAASAPAMGLLSPEQLAQQGSDALAADDAATAIKAFTALSQAQPNNASALLSLADAYQKAKNPLQAIEMYNRCAKLSPNDWRVDYGLGTIYLQQEYFRLARPYLERARGLAPSQPQARGRVVYNLSLCYRGMHQLSPATDRAREALALDPTNIEARRLLITLYMEASRLDDAAAETRATLEALRANLAKTPDDRAIAEQLLQVLTMWSNLLQAQIAAKPDDPAPRLQLADVYEQLSRVTEQVTYHNALDQVDAALKSAPQDPDVLFAHGRLQYLIGHPVQAAEDLQALLKIAPEDTRAKQLLAKIQVPASQAAEKP